MLSNKGEFLRNWGFEREFLVGDGVEKGDFMGMKEHSWRPLSVFLQVFAAGIEFVADDGITYVLQMNPDLVSTTG